MKQSFAWACAGIALTLSLSSCVFEDSAPDKLDPSKESASTAPFTDAYVEYPGPSERWSGPSGFVFHVHAKGGAKEAEVTMTPPLLRLSSAPQVAKAQSPSDEGKRAPAAAAADAAAPHSLKSVEGAREEINRFYETMKSGTPDYAGCLYPVRARLIRADGSMIEKEGCRASSGWPKAASEMLDRFAKAAVDGKVQEKVEEPRDE